MQEYLFVLGRDFELSLVELISYFSSNNISFKLKEYNREFAIFILPDINFGNLINRLGGTVKIARIEVGGINKGYIESLFSGLTSNKIIISISSLSGNKLVESFLDEFKKILRYNKIKFIIKTDMPPSKITSMNVLEKGFDFVIFKGHIARTICVSNPKIFDKRDKQRPNNDFLRGTSLRVSRILINMSGVKANQVILDPFCGLGIIIEEGLFLGYDVLGVEIDSNVARKATQNLKYFSDRYKLKNKFNIKNADSKKIGNIIRPSDFNVIVCEPYLGPYIRNTYALESAKKVCLELESLYNPFFSSLSKIVKDQKIVMIFPKFKTKEGKIIGPNMREILSSNGFIMDDISNLVKIPIRYSAPKSKIIREIYVFKKK